MSQENIPQKRRAAKFCMVCVCVWDILEADNRFVGEVREKARIHSQVKPKSGRVCYSQHIWRIFTWVFHTVNKPGGAYGPELTFCLNELACLRILKCQTNCLTTLTSHLLRIFFGMEWICHRFPDWTDCSCLFQYLEVTLAKVNKIQQLEWMIQ